MSKRNIKKVKRDRLEIEAMIIEACPAGMFRLEIGKEKVSVIGVLSGKMRQNFIKVVPGDYVIIELSEYDMTKGRIVKRLDKSGNQ